MNRLITKLENEVYVSTRECDAEALLTTADAMLYPRGMLLIAEDGLGGAELAIVKLAIDLRARPNLSFRAVAEGWDRKRVIRELY